MKIIKVKSRVFEQNCILELMEFSKSDGKEWKRVFDLWRGLKLGLRDYKSREPNLPEGLSEVAFCLWSGSLRFISAKGLKNKSFDTFNLKTGRAEQIKACSVADDLTSFGPKSKWDDLYFLDFYSGGKTDGRFDIYKIPNNLIYENKVNKRQTLVDQQGEKRRPRLCIKKSIIQQLKLKPIAKSVKIW
ncbi:MAG TPA: Bsp6I family type II restriction endonuclease [bacterium]|nr:Bsp6I family type II restriction endonuclease [bacterium]HOR57277.1 Bsp6I family type II restriction endonuclease [bacterium]